MAALRTALLVLTVLVLVPACAEDAGVPRSGESREPPPGSDAGVDEPALLRAHAAVIERTAPDRLVVTAANGTRHVFTDDVTDGELRSAHRLVSVPEKLYGLVIVRQYVPEGRTVLMVDRRTGTVLELDDVPVPSPDGHRFATASLDLVAGHAPNRVRIYRTTDAGARLEAEWQPREWGARNATWLDVHTLQLERGVVDWSTHELLTAPMVLRYDGDRWTPEHTPEQARIALLAFLAALGEGHYMEATWLYGGSYDTMRMWNPDMAPDDLPGLWRSACLHNGLQCLGRAEPVDVEVLSATDLRFTVHLLTAAGERFVLGPCCGETEETMPPQRVFTFTVRRSGDRYLVLDTPPYMP
jgi:hypothetical protein